jgi:hypothetical protein
MTFCEFPTSLLELVSLVSASLLFMAITLLIYCRWSVLLSGFPTVLMSLLLLVSLLVLTPLIILVFIL